MKFQINKKSIVLLLFSVAIFFLVTNLILDFVIKDINQTSANTKVTILEIDSLFHLSLDSFGILDEWIKKKKTSKENRYYKVMVPFDLSIPEILTEINSNFWKKDIEISSVEKKFSGKTILEIKTNDEAKLTTEFDYDKNIHRFAGSVAFILENFKLSNTDDSLLIDVPEPFSPLLTPSTENVEISKFINRKGKTYSLLLNDDITELKYKLKDSYSQKRLKGSLLSIINDFSSASYFIIDDQSDLYKSSIFSYLQDELSKRKINLIKISTLHKLDFDNKDLLISTFDTIMKNLGDGQSITIYVNSENFRILLPEIKRYRKVGYQIVHPSETMVKEK